MVWKRHNTLKNQSSLTLIRKEAKQVFRDFLVIFVFLSLLCNLAWGSDPTAYVINTLGETLSKVNLKTDQVENDILTLGSAPGCGPNQILIRDTLAYVVLSLTSEIQMIDLTRQSTVAYIDLGQGRNPFWMAFSETDTQYAWVTCSAADSLFKVDLVSGSGVAGYPIGLWPEGILILDRLAYVCISAFDMHDYTYGQGKVIVFDTETNSVIKELNVGTNPQYIASDNEGEIYVSCTGDFWSSWGVIYVIDQGLNTIKDSIAIGGSPCQIAVSADDLGWLAAGGWGTDGLLFVFDSRTDSTIFGSGNPISVSNGSGIMSVVDLPDSTVLACAFQADELVKIDTSSGSVLKRYQVGDGPAHLAVSYTMTSSDVIHEVAEQADAKSLALFQSYPNPFNSITLIRFAPPTRCQVKIEIFNILGQRMITLVDQGLESGLKEVTWDGRDHRGRHLTSGIYFYRMKAGELCLSKKMVILR